MNVYRVTRGDRTAVVRAEVVGFTVTTYLRERVCSQWYVPKLDRAKQVAEAEVEA